MWSVKLRQHDTLSINLEAVILVNHAAYECSPNTRRSEAAISIQIFWINTCCVTGFRSVISNGEFDVWCVAASLGCLPVLRSVSTSIRKRRGLWRRKHFVSLKKNGYNSSTPHITHPPPNFFPLHPYIPHFYADDRIDLKKLISFYAFSLAYLLLQARCRAAEFISIFARLNIYPTNVQNWVSS
jgi:hypothetical protein